MVGSDDERGFEAMRSLYRPMTERGIPLIETDVRTAELAKLASNAFLATKISFANALGAPGRSDRCRRRRARAA